MEKKLVEKTGMTEEEIIKIVEDAGSDNLQVFGGTYVGGIKCQQIPDEFAKFVIFMQENGIKIDSYFELGVAAGGTTYLINQFFKPKNIVLLDNNSNPACPLRPYVLKGIKYKEIIADARDEQGALKAEEYGPYDFMMIDAVHDYINARLDVAVYSIYLAKGGILFLHDTRWQHGQVDRVVRELKKDNRFEFLTEIVSNRHTSNSCGIGLFRRVL